MTDQRELPGSPGELVLSVTGATKRFGGVAAVTDLSLELASGELLALLGPSGCGKTTALRLIAGLEAPDGGVVTIGGRMVAGAGVFVPPERRHVGMVFQDFALFPHMTVADNVSFGLQGWDRKAQARRVREVLEMVRLEHFARRYPHELSGGERQRVALVRALAPGPLIVLLDEPFSNLDPALRVQLRQEVRELLKACGTAAIFVTHDQDEALFLGDRVAVMKEGRVEQVGPPEEVFHHPKTPFVATFLGRADLLPATVTDRGLLAEGVSFEQAVALAPGTRVEVAMRPDDVALEPLPGANGSHGEARVEARWFRGTHHLYRVALPSGAKVHSLQPHTVRLEVGTAVVVRIKPGRSVTFFANGSPLCNGSLVDDRQPVP